MLILFLGHYTMHAVGDVADISEVHALECIKTHQQLMLSSGRPLKCSHSKKLYSVFPGEQYSIKISSSHWQELLKAERTNSDNYNEVTILVKS
jgi:hypothetical protein